MKAYDAKREESPPGTIAHLEASMGRLRYSLGPASTCVWTFVAFEASMQKQPHCTTLQCHMTRLLWQGGLLFHIESFSLMTPKAAHEHLTELFTCTSHADKTTKVTA